jgi:hypothetical protein
MKKCPEDDDGGGPRVIRVKVSWLGSRALDGTVVCRGGEHMVPLGVEDVISRDAIIYEEHTPGDVKYKKDLSLTAPSLKKITSVIPKPYLMEPREQGAALNPTPAPTVTYNHAGIAIRPNEPPRGAEERARWDAAWHEIEGFTWTDPKTAEDPDPPSWRVTNMRREEGVMYAVALSSYNDVVYDLELGNLRKKMYRSKMGKVIRAPPMMLQWRVFKDASLSINFDLIHTNAVAYQEVVR